MIFFSACTFKPSTEEIAEQAYIDYMKEKDLISPYKSCISSYENMIQEIDNSIRDAIDSAENQDDYSEIVSYLENINLNKPYRCVDL